MKGTNLVTTICGCGAAVFGAITSMVPDKYKVACGIMGAAFGAAFAYFAKGRDVTGGTVNNKGNEVKDGCAKEG